MDKVEAFAIFIHIDLNTHHFIKKRLAHCRQKYNRMAWKQNIWNNTLYICMKQTISWEQFDNEPIYKIWYGIIIVTYRQNDSG